MSQESPAACTLSSQFAFELFDLCMREESPSLGAVLARIVKEFNAFGCIVWECFPRNELGQSSVGDTLFTLTSWFPKGIFFTVADLPLDGSVSGRALVQRSPFAVVNVQEEGGPKHDHPFLSTNHIGPLCSVPFRFHDKREGTLDLLRTVDQNAFSQAEIDNLALVARQLPRLYRARRERLSLDLIEASNQILQAVEWSLETALEIDQRLEMVCRRVAEAYKALEVSIILNETLASFGKFEVRATTWNEVKGELRKVYNIEEHQKDPSCPIKHKTEWVIRNNKPILLLRLSDTMPAESATRYPGLEVQENREFILAAIAKIKAQPDRGVSSKDKANEEDPPISYIAVPVRYGNHTLGAIRICATFSPPHYFPQRDVALLEVVAGQIAHFWGTWLHMSSHKEQLDSVTNLANGISTLNGAVHEEINKNRPDLVSILQKAVDTIVNVIPFAEAVDVRSYDGQRKHLKFCAIGGSQWNQLDPQSQETVRQITFAVPDNRVDFQARSAGEYVFRTRRPYWAANLDQQHFYRTKSFFPERRQAITVPVIAGNHMYGVLDVSTSSLKEFSPHLRKLIELFGTQLGMYYSLIEAIEERQQILGEIDRRYEELAHQLKGPLGQARERADRILRYKFKGKEIRDIEWKAIRGLCRKALGVLRILAFGSGMQSELNIKPDIKNIDQPAEVIRTILEEAAFDYELYYHRSDIQFFVDRLSISTLFGNRRVMLDRELFEQVVANIFDNAIKYSYRSTRIDVKAIRLPSNEVCIEVANRGIPLTPEDAANCMKRGWRGATAKNEAAEGMGLGLWLVKYISKLLGGRIEIIPTENGLTRVHIVLK